MKIISNTDATVLGHDGHEYVIGKDGTFDVPQEVGEALIRFPSWDREYVAKDRQTAEEKKAAESFEGVLKRLGDLESAVFGGKDEKPKYEGAKRGPKPKVVVENETPEKVEAEPDEPVIVEADSAKADD